MILIVTFKEKTKSGRYETFVSHGVDDETGKNICLPQVPVKELSPDVAYSNDYGWHLKDR